MSQIKDGLVRRNGGAHAHALRGTLLTHRHLSPYSAAAAAAARTSARAAGFRPQHLPNGAANLRRRHEHKRRRQARLPRQLIPAPLARQPWAPPTPRHVYVPSCVHMTCVCAFCHVSCPMGETNLCCGPFIFGTAYLETEATESEKRKTENGATEKYRPNPNCPPIDLFSWLLFWPFGYHNHFLRFLYIPDNIL